MNLSSEDRKNLAEKFGKNATDTGMPEVQVAIFTHRIKHLTGHLKTNKKDFVTERSLLRLVGKRKKLLSYIKEKDIEKYRTLIQQLEIRK
ncbi:MAG: 30S ribosomal protein S15 [Bacteroidetes bacterium HGW-Bacteroidetes-6]|jgi:small subunit ribosomal protein S15|nr:MAG: 30S ribosomal protein S15 [Bacteroidetes bacterium HGW-Bacteroidetes-6]